MILFKRYLDFLTIQLHKISLNDILIWIFKILSAATTTTTYLLTKLKRTDLNMLI